MRLSDNTWLDGGFNVKLLPIVLNVNRLNVSTSW